MSLRTKIILLFGLLAVVPMLALAGFSYSYAQKLLRNSVQGQLHETAQMAGEELVLRAAAIDAAMDDLARSVLLENGDGGDEAFSPAPSDGGFPASLPDPRLAGAAFVQLRDGLGPIRTLFGAVPEAGTRCGSDGRSQILEFAREVDGDGGAETLVAGFWSADLVPWEGRSPSHSLLLVDSRMRTILFADRCPEEWTGERIPPGSSLATVLASGAPGSFSFDEDGAQKLGASWSDVNRGWVVLATSASVAIAGPVRQMVVTYWLFVLCLGFSTSLAFSILLGRFTKSLRELARAAEEIGTGELDPWLPVPTSGEVGQLTLAFSRMLARIRQMMTQVDQSGRLAVVGQLSAYLAHEIRNPLSSIKLNLQRLRRWTLRGELPEFCLEPLEISLKEVDRLNASVSGVLQLSKAHDSPRQVVGLHALVEEAAELLSSRFRRLGVSLVLDLDAQADHVLAREGQLKSVILNLMVNALEAQPEGGSLEVRTELAKEPEIGGPVLALHFKDQGSGISSEIRDRVFEPFFTTKEGGSGIGLAMAFQAVRDNDGDLYLEPAISQDAGAEFVVVFPLAAVGPNAGTKPKAGRPLVNYRGLSPRWATSKRPSDAKPPERTGVPEHLMTPEGLEAVLALSNPDSEDVN